MDLTCCENHGWKEVEPTAVRKQVWKAWLCGSGDYILLIFPYMGESPPSGEYVCSLLSGSWTASTSLSPKDFTGDSH